MIKRIEDPMDQQKMLRSHFLKVKIETCRDYIKCEYSWQMDNYFKGKFPETILIWSCEKEISDEC